MMMLTIPRGRFVIGLVAAAVAIGGAPLAFRPDVWLFTYVTFWASGLTIAAAAVRYALWRPRRRPTRPRALPGPTAVAVAPAPPSSRVQVQVVALPRGQATAVLELDALAGMARMARTPELAAWSRLVTGRGGWVTAWRDPESFAIMVREVVGDATRGRV